MKVIIYTLTETGEIPSYVIDGGYFPKSNTNNSPQDLDLIGLADNSATETSLASKSEILEYVKSFLNDYESPTTGKIFTVEEMVETWCSERNID
jgi:hypothetical protein